MPKGAAKVVLTKHAGTSRMIMKRRLGNVVS